MTIEIDGDVPGYMLHGLHALPNVIKAILIRAI